jgi:hypothetical protein
MNNGGFMTTEKAGKILQKMKERDRQTTNHWTPYRGPADWDFIVLNAPKKELEEGRDERPELSNG